MRGVGVPDWASRPAANAHRAWVSSAAAAPARTRLGEVLVLKAYHIASPVTQFQEYQRFSQPHDAAKAFPTDVTYVP